MPAHIAAIMDGNGRWARQRGLPRVVGHREGVKSLREIVRTCAEVGVKYLTVYTFSTENWQRPRTEVRALMGLLARTIKHEQIELMKNRVRVRTIGRIQDLPASVQARLLSLVSETASNAGLTLTLAVSYGGRAEVVRACQLALARRIRPDSESDFAQLLYDPDLPDPDLLIRTGGDHRISNFLLWQLAYTELYFTETLWPDFRREQLLAAVEEYGRRQRRFGRI